MPNYAWSGPGQLRELSLDRSEAPEITEPLSPRVIGIEQTERLHKCLVSGCGRKFRKAMIAARHFNASHSDLREDKGSWREYVEEVTN